MKGHRQTVLLLTLLAALLLFVIFPGFLAPYDYSEQDRERPFAPPNRMHVVDSAGGFHARPFVYAYTQRMDAVGSVYEEDRTHMYPLRLLVTGAPYSIIGSWKSRTHLFGVDAPGRFTVLGTDDFGRDVLSRVLYGGRISVLAGMIATVVALLAGGALGIISGYYGKWADALVMRLVELFLALPWLYLLFAVRAVLPLHIKTTDAFLLLVGVMGLVGWARPARLVRGIVLSAKERNFVLAARVMGGSDFHILRRHVLPQTHSVLLTMAALLVPQFILAEVTLSFLGLGVGEPMPSWGNLLAELQKYSVLNSYWWMFSPAVLLVALFLACHWVSTALQEKLGAVSV